MTEATLYNSDNKRISSLSTSTSPLQNESFPTKDVQEMVDPVAQHLSVIQGQQTSSPTEKLPRLIEDVKSIAESVIQSDIRNVTTKDGKELSVLTAGRSHFKALWTRDACFASFGLIEEGQHLDTVRNTLSVILDAQSKEGALPARMGQHKNFFLLLLETLHIRTPECTRLDKVKYQNGRGEDQIDCNALPIIAAHRYIARTGDTEFLKTHYAQLSSACRWLEARIDNSLIHQSPSGDWKDMIGRKGAVMYTNALAYQALRLMSDLDAQMGFAKRSEERKHLAVSMKLSIQQSLWNEKEGYFKDSDSHTGFSSDGNLLAVLFDIADSSQKERIFHRFSGLLSRSGLPFPALDGEYPTSFIPFSLRFFGLRHYHDRMVWPWLGSALAAAAVHAGQDGLAKQVLSRIARQVRQDGTFYEIYDLNPHPKPVRTWAYKSEPGFLWSAGTFIWALSLLQKSSKLEADLSRKGDRAPLHHDKAV